MGLFAILLALLFGSNLLTQQKNRPHAMSISDEACQLGEAC